MPYKKDAKQVLTRFSGKKAEKRSFRSNSSNRIAHISNGVGIEHLFRFLAKSAFLAKKQGYKEKIAFFS